MLWRDRLLSKNNDIHQYDLHIDALEKHISIDVHMD